MTLNTLGPLAAETMTTLRAFFEARNHHPSEDHWAALEDIATTLESMADGRCDPVVHLSAIDCGVGKSSTVAHFARALVASETHRDCGMVICVGRISEARTIATDLGIPRECLAVLTSDKDANALSGAAPGNAQVLVTTQQRIEMACDGKSFEGVAAFHYRGRPRAIRAWDEAWLPGAVVTLERDALYCLLRSVRRVSVELANVLEDFAISLRDVEDGALVNVPDFAAVSGVSPWEVLTAAAGIGGRFRDDLQLAATALVTMSGKAARARCDGHSRATILTYRDVLPDDLAPLLVLDASGRVRETYRNVEKHRGTLRRLREAVKDYGPLTVNVWRTSGSKSGWGRDADKLIDGIVQTIETRPDQPWLVVLHKPDAKIPDLLKAIRKGLAPETAANVRALTWGQHMATNDHADVNNVILAGTLFMAPSFYTALTHLSQDRDVAPGLASGDEIAQTIRGEHANLILQALCRGRVRKSDGSRCLPMEAWIIASVKSGIPADIDAIFPGCTVQPWKPQGVTKTLSGKPLDALQAVKEDLRSGVEWITFRSIADRLTMDLRDFKKRVAANDEWISAVTALGVVEGTGHRGTRGLRKVDPMAGSEAA